MKKPFLSLFEIESSNITDNLDTRGRTLTETVEDTDNDIISLELGTTYTFTREDTDPDNLFYMEYTI